MNLFSYLILARFSVLCLSGLVLQIQKRKHRWIGQDGTRSLEALLEDFFTYMKMHHSGSFIETLKLPIYG